MPAEAVVFISGATGALGRAVAAHFERQGARLAVVGSRKASLEAAFPDLAAKHVKLAADLTDAYAAGAAVAEAEQKLGRIDALCAIAGAFHMGEPVHATPPDAWSTMTRVNVATFVNVARATVPGMIARKSGKIVTVGSIAALKGGAQMGAYAASKNALMRLTESMSAELKGNGINVNCVLPSTIDTQENRKAMPKADFSKWVVPDDLAAVIGFLCSDAAKPIHGALIPVAGLV
jgi:NAD(P)-dependent dehydrogenase (short-subunit alcohol dehydrogenase family)